MQSRLNYTEYITLNWSSLKQNKKEGCVRYSERGNKKRQNIGKLLLKFPTNMAWFLIRGKRKDAKLLEEPMNARTTLFYNVLWIISTTIDWKRASCGDAKTSKKLLLLIMQQRAYTKQWTVCNVPEGCTIHVCYTSWIRLHLGMPTVDKTVEY